MYQCVCEYCGDHVSPIISLLETQDYLENDLHPLG